MPGITFMSSLIYYKNQKMKEAEKKALQTFFADSNAYDIFLGRPVPEIANSNFDLNSIKDFYSEILKLIDVTDYTNWLIDFEKSSIFVEHIAEFQALREKQLSEQDETIAEELFEKIIKLKRLENY